MHFDMVSATGLRERRIAETSARLTSVARAWTVERGFGGFTIDELCEAVGVSRRTFFNYFAGKEDAVIGVPVRVDHAEAEARFLAGSTGTAAGALSPTLLVDLAELMVVRWEALGVGAGDVEALVAAMEHAPRLLGRTLEITREQEQADIALVERREGLPPGDLRAATAVHLLGSILRGAVEETFRDAADETLRTVFARRIAVARGLFAS